MELGGQESGPVLDITAHMTLILYKVPCILDFTVLFLLNYLVTEMQ